MTIFARLKAELLVVASRWGTDSRDGRDWTPRPLPRDMR